MIMTTLLGDSANLQDEESNVFWLVTGTKKETNIGN